MKSFRIFFPCLPSSKYLVPLIFFIHYLLIYLFLDYGICSLEWWSFELIILQSGLLPNPKLETSVLAVW